MSVPPSDGSPADAIAHQGERALPAERETGTLIDLLPAIVYVADTGVEGAWHYISSGAEAITGFTPEQWMGDIGLWGGQVPPDDRAQVFGREENLVEPATPDEYRIRHRDGSTVWVRDEAVLLTDAHGREGWHGVMLDITDRKLAELELERRAAQQAAVARLGERALEGTDVARLMHDSLEDAARILGVEMGAVLAHGADDGGLGLRAGLGLPRGAKRPEHAAYPFSELPLGITGQIEGRAGRWGVLLLAAPAEGTPAPA